MVAIRQAPDLTFAGPLLERALRHDVTGPGGALADMIGGCAVFEVLDGSKVIGAFAARADDYSDGRVLTVTAAGGLPGYDITAAIDAWMTLQATGPAGARRLECITRRPGLIKKLQAAGYHVAGYLMAKDVQHGLA